MDLFYVTMWERAHRKRWKREAQKKFRSRLDKPSTTSKVAQSDFLLPAFKPDEKDGDQLSQC